MISTATANHRLDEVAVTFTPQEQQTILAYLRAGTEAAHAACAAVQPDPARSNLRRTIRQVTHSPGGRQPADRSPPTSAPHGRPRDGDDLEPAFLEHLNGGS